jgi:ABC-type cobalamin/Fe3+-siderophores transport system ATPase subunit
MTPPQSQPVLEITELTKTYPVGLFSRQRRMALDALTLSLAPGELLGYLGPNGSGKTTTLKILNGLLSPDAGEILVLGRPLADRSWRFRAGYLPEHPYLYDYLTAREYLDYVGRLFGMPAPARRERTRHLLALVGLERSADVALRRFSKGMIQRAGLAQALSRQSRFAEAEAEYRQLLDQQRSILGVDNPDTLETMHNLANMYLAQGNYGEAEKLFRETLQVEQRVLGPEHPDTANAMTTLANTIRFDDLRSAEAEKLYRKSLEIELRVLGPDHPYTTRTQEGLANVLSAENRYAEAETLLRQILIVRQRLLNLAHIIHRNEE